MMDRARKLLSEAYGYSAFRGQQHDVIEAALAGRDCLVLMPTGGGKSLCYQLPSLLREGTGIVVSPLIALMRDQVAALTQIGIRAAYLNSSLSWAEQARVIDDVEAGALDLLYVAPERLLQERTLERLKPLPISLIAIDEAHCVSQWGHDFRQDYLGLDVLREHFPGVPRMALTATADERTRTEIVTRLALTNPIRFVGGFDRPNIRYSVSVKTDARRAARNSSSWRRGAAKPASSIVCRAAASTRQRSGCANRASTRCRITRGSVPWSVPRIRTGFCATTASSSLRRSRSAWASTNPTCATSRTSICRKASSRTIRRPAAPAATVCRPKRGWSTACRMWSASAA